MSQTPETQDADTGVPVWAVVAVVLVATALLALPLWWVLDTYLLTGGEETEAGTGTAQTTLPLPDMQPKCNRMPVFPAI
jgi:hypothetical protein